MPADCGQPDTFDRLGLIRHAAGALHAAPGSAVYLDAGNSGWHPAAEMAARLAAAGVAAVEGFALNVSNYHPTEDEIRKSIEARAAARSAKNFAESDRIRKDLDARGVLIKDSPQGTTWSYK